MPCAIKSSFHTGLLYRSLSLEINRTDSHISFDKNWFSRLKSEITSLWIGMSRNRHCNQERCNHERFEPAVKTRIFTYKRLHICSRMFCALQMKGRWESKINVWFLVIYSQKWKCYFQNRIIMFCLPVPTLIYLWEIYIFTGSVCLFCCREICGPILRIWKIAHRHKNFEVGTEATQFSEKEYLHKWDFRCSVEVFNASSLQIWDKIGDIA